MSIWEAIAQLLASVRLWTVIAQYEGGIRLRCGRLVATLAPGFHWQWPVVDTIMAIDTVPKLVDLVNQSVTTEDDKCVAFSGAVEYTVTDPAKALTSVYDVGTAVQTAVMGFLAQQLSASTYAECQDADSIEDAVIKQFKPKARKWGLRIDRVYLTDLAPHRVIRLLSPTPYAHAETE